MTLTFPHTPTSESVEINRKINRFLDSYVPWVRKGAIVHISFYDGMTVDPDTGRRKYKSPAVAWYDPANGDLRVDLRRLGYDPESAEWRKLSGEFTTNFPNRRSAQGWRRVWGLLVHEASHSQWSTWRPIAGTPRAVADVMETLEELRIERRAVNNPTAHQDIHVALRSSAGYVHEMLDWRTVTTTVRLARVWALLWGRVNAGVLDPEDVSDVDVMTRIALGDETVDLLVDLLDEAIELDAETPTGLRRFHEIAAEWLALLSDDSDDGGEEGSGGEGEGDPGGGGGGGGGGEGEGEGEGKSGDGAEGGGDEGGSDDAKDASGDPDYGELGSEAGESRGGSDGRLLDADELKRLRRIMERTLDQVELSSVRPRLSDPKQKVNEVFSRGPEAALSRRVPSDVERRAVTRLTHELETLTIPAIRKISRHTTVPPGRLRSREALRASAERSMGRMSTATPWESTKRRRTVAPPMVVGVMTDTSGSMRWAEELVAQVAYIFGAAGHRVGARTAAVTFGDEVYPVVSANTRPVEVVRYPADGGQERFDWAAAALDGALNLSLHSGAAKVLVIVSDAHLVIDGEPERANAWLDRWIAAGVQVVWVGARHRYASRKAGVVHVAVKEDSDTDPGYLIGIVMRELKKKMGRGN